MSSKFVHVVIISLIAVAVVPFGMNAIGLPNSPPIDPALFRLFLATSMVSWTSLVFFSVYLTIARHELANFAWIAVIGVFGSYFLINLILSTLA